uniref:Uncharacterized protein n=1 Tax=Acrobeloides nanus TaxID=290746 RepID=A0A914DYX6_9BILA
MGNSKNWFCSIVDFYPLFKKMKFFSLLSLLFLVIIVVLDYAQAGCLWAVTDMTGALTCLWKDPTPDPPTLASLFSGRR